MSKEVDEKYIRRCFQLASKAEGFTNPNPLVGCVIVKEDKIVGEGYHQKAGQPHAEVLALQQAGSNAIGATLYTNLEPCNHYGKTPPCTESIKKFKIAKVIYSVNDPNPISGGKGIDVLRQDGLEVEGGVLKEEAEELNLPYFKFITKNVPYVTVKIAQSLDGKIATYKGESKWITGKEARSCVQNLRNKIDAIMVGINTVLKDNPYLIPHLDAKSKIKQIKRIVLDSKLRLPLNNNVFENIDSFPLFIATTSKVDLERRRLYENKGANIILAGNKKVDVKLLMKELAKREVMHVLVEGGGEVIASCLDADVIDEVFCFIAPKLLGGRDTITSVEGKGIKRLDEAIKLEDIEVKRMGEDVLIHGYIYR